MPRGQLLLRDLEPNVGAIRNDLRGWIALTTVISPMWASHVPLSLGFGPRYFWRKKSIARNSPVSVS
jgi:hypothetical protein